MAKIKAGPNNAITDVAGVRVGHYDEGPTGVTVVLAPDAGAVAGVDVRGSAPATRETDLLRPTNLVQRVHAVVLSGGSAFGLRSADGVMRWLAERGRGFPVGEGHVVPIVPAAALFDLGRGGNWTVQPEADWGRRACESASDGKVPQGNVGAGAGAAAGGLKGGLGTASALTPSGVTVGALVALNPLGAVADPDSGRLYAAEFGLPGEFEGLTPHAARGPAGQEGPLRNTTLAVVATDAALSKAEATKLAQMSHDGLARTIRPAHTMFDGDAVFALATGEREFEPEGEVPFGAEGAIKVNQLGALAADVLARAVGHAVLHAESAWGVASYREQHLGG